MASKKLNKKLLREKQVAENKKFNRIMLLSFSMLSICLMSVHIFYTYWCETRLVGREITWYGKEVPGIWTCMNSDNLKTHESSILEYKGNTYYFCSQKCYNHLVQHFEKVALTIDAYSGDTIYKADALMGLRKRGNPSIVYFENIENFNNYYAKKIK